MDPKDGGDPHPAQIFIDFMQFSGKMVKIMIVLVEHEFSDSYVTPIVYLHSVTNQDSFQCK